MLYTFPKQMLRDSTRTLSSIRSQIKVPSGTKQFHSSITISRVTNVRLKSWAMWNTFSSKHNY